MGSLGSEGQLVMLFYLICDVSASMEPELDALHDEIVELRNAIAGDPVLDGAAQVCVMTFGDKATVHVELMQMSDLPEDEIPAFDCEVHTLYGEAFREVAYRIKRDYMALKLDRYQVHHRPCVYFLTDGEPSDRDWRTTLEQTLSETAMADMNVPSFYPVVVPFGYRNAMTQTMSRLAYPPGGSRWYHTRDTTPDVALVGILDIITRSMRASTLSVRTGQPELVLPDPERGSGIDSGFAEYY